MALSSDAAALQALVAAEASEAARFAASLTAPALALVEVAVSAAASSAATLPLASASAGSSGAASGFAPSSSSGSGTDSSSSSSSYGGPEPGHARAASAPAALAARSRPGYQYDDDDDEEEDEDGGVDMEAERPLPESTAAELARLEGTVRETHEVNERIMAQNIALLADLEHAQRAVRDLRAGKNALALQLRAALERERERGATAATSPR